MEERIVRIGNRSRLFWTQGKSIFNKKTSSNSLDDSVKNEEKEALLSETDTDNNKEMIEATNHNEEIMELGKKISPLLTNLRKAIEEGKLFPNSREWVDSALPILGNCIEVASQNKRKDLEQLFVDIARIIYSSDRVGKSHLSIEPSLELYSLLCCVVADFMRGKPNKPMFEQWTKSYQKVVTDFINSGIRLVDDNEEPITTSVSEIENNYSTSEITTATTPVDNTPSQDILPSTDEISTSLPEVENIDIPQPDNLKEEKEYPEITAEATNDINPILQETTSLYTIETSLPEKTDEPPSSTTQIQETNEILTENDTLIIQEEKETDAEPAPISTTEQSSDIDISTFLQQINQISQNEVKEILLDTLKAIANGTPETAKAKAIELAKEMAKLEVEKVKTEYRSTEYQIESLSSEIHQVEEQLNICQNEIKTIEEELKEQQSITQKTEKEKNTLENHIKNTEDKIADIEKRILELQKQKEAEITNLNQYKEQFDATEKNIEELNQSISSLKESIRDFENQAMTLLQRMDSLEATKSQKETQLEQLQKQIKERESTVRRLEETIWFLHSIDNASTNHKPLYNSNTQNTIDLFNGKV